MEGRSPGCGLTLAQVAAWLSSSALVLTDILLVRGALLSVLTWLGARQGHAPTSYSQFGWTLEFVDRALLLILGCVGIGLAVGLEYYYRRGAETGDLARRAIRGLGSLLAVGLAALALQLAF
ncbi:MAG: hypothetical protein FJ011_02440 [Chloroflexi bacterium]|nr:hypothetical protein [Chloroflexota bacterium]